MVKFVYRLFPSMGFEVIASASIEGANLPQLFLMLSVLKKVKGKEGLPMVKRIYPLINV